MKFNVVDNIDRIYSRSLGIASQMAQQRGSASGGQLLRQLRERKGWSQYDVEVESEAITAAHLSRLEGGKIQPSREKLQGVLDAYEASVHERKEVLRCFGYLPPVPLPDHHAIQAAEEHSQPVLDETPTPAYLIEKPTTRLWNWNRFFAMLLGEEGEGILETMRGMPLLQASFQRKNELADFIENHDGVMIDEVKTNIYRRLEPFKYEEWYSEFIAELIYDEPDLAQYMEQATSEQEPHVTELPTKAVEPVQFNAPGIRTPLLFFGHSQPLTIDARFEIIYLLPATTFTLEVLADWRATDNSLQ